MASRDALLALGGVGGVALVLSQVMSRKPTYQLVAAVVFTWFVVLGVGYVRPVYGRGEEPIAKLARIAESKSPEDRAPLIVSSGLYAPTPLFYSNRPILEGQTAEDLAGLIKDGQPQRIILAKQDLASLANVYEIHVLAEAECHHRASVASSLRRPIARAAPEPKRHTRVSGL
jgi:hypothetical protein